MRLLLDTHVLLWWLSDEEKLTSEARDAIADPENTIYLSAVVVWEIRIKEAIGKLSLPDAFIETLARQAFVELPITVEQANEISRLPDIHRDPFDRLLIAQAVVEDLTIITRDSVIPDYPVRVVSA